MAIQLDTATIIALIVESLLFGIFTVLFSISSFILVSRRKQSQPINKPLITVSIIMYILGLSHLCISAQRMIIAFLELRNEAGGPSAYLALSANPLYLANIGIYTAQTLIGDSFMAYRLYIIWGKDKRLLCLASAFLIASTISGVIAPIDAGRVGPSTPIFIPRLKHWILAFFSLTLATNLIFTTLIAYRIWSVEKRLNEAIAERHHTPVLSVIVESSAIYSISLISLTGLFASGSWAEYIMLDALVQLVGIVFSLIIVRIGLGISHGATSVSQSRRFTFNSRLGENGIRRGAQMPMHPLVIRIDESRVTDDMPTKTVSTRASQDD